MTRFWLRNPSGEIMNEVNIFLEFVKNLLITVENLYRTPVNDLYLETAGWEYRRGLNVKEGLIPKAIRLLKNTIIKEITPLSIIGTVPSESSNKTYTTKVLIDPDTLIEFSCNCQWGEFRARPCKHVLATVFKPLEHLLNIREDLIVKTSNYIAYQDYNTYTILSAIHTALNKAAFLKVKLGENFA